MAQKTIAQYISGIRGTLKLNNADTRIDDRHIYLKMVEVRSLVIQQSNKWLMSSVDIFQTMPNVELEDVDTVEACGIVTKCKIKRSVDKLPIMLEDAEGPLIKRVSSLDGYIDLQLTTPTGFVRKLRKSTFKYDKNLYFWINNGYLYLPNVEWDGVLVEAYFDVDIVEGCEDNNPCKNFQDNMFRIPERLVAPMISMVTERLMQTYIQIPQDTKLDKNENSK